MNRIKLWYLISGLIEQLVEFEKVTYFDSIKLIL